MNVGQVEDASDSQAVHVYTMLSVNDQDLLPHFLKHYRALGADGFRFILNGSWTPQAIESLGAEPNVEIFRHTRKPFIEPRRIRLMNKMAEAQTGRWGLFVDADEFLELPFRSLRRTIAIMQVLQLDSLPALLMQRTSRDGSLPAVPLSADLDALFPLVNMHLCEEMGVAKPIWKTKYPLARITERFRFQRGNHLPPNRDAPMTAPLRAVVHHFKWRDALTLSLCDGRGNSNEAEQAAYHAYLQSHDWRVPTKGAMTVKEADLAGRGVLVRPSRRTLLAFSTRRKLRAAQSDEGFGAAATPLQGSTAPWIETARDRELLDPDNLKLKPGSVCLIACEITGPSQTGGIGTAVAAQAELLRSAGHDVQVLFTPFSTAQELSPLWLEYWAARGVKVHHLPRSNNRQARSTAVSVVLAATKWLRRRDFDLLHFHDSHGLGARVAALKAAGRGFSRTAIVTTEHGNALWHRRANWLPTTDDEPEDGFLQGQSIWLSDLALFPSRYMMNWVRENMRLSARVNLVLPNVLLGSNRSFNERLNGSQPRPISEIVFFGRLEFRKGLDLFLDAVEQIRDSIPSGFQITLIGRRGLSVKERLIHRRIAELGVETRIISNFDTHNAVGYLKTRNCLVVIPSRVDNLPYTAYECLENGVPMLATRAGGIVELVDRRDQGLAFVADTVADLAEALRSRIRTGAPVARLDFDASHVELATLCLHAKLVDEARRGKLADAGAQAVPNEIVYGSVGRSGATDRTFTNDGRRLPAAGAEEKRAWIDAVNSAVARSSDEILILRHAAVRPLEKGAASLVKLLADRPIDASVGGYRVEGADGKLGRPIPVLGGPGERGVRWNVFGVGYFAITRAAFARAGGFDPKWENEPLAHWDLLNRLAALGGSIVAVPAAVASVRSDPARHALADLVLKELLLRPWIAAAPPPLANLTRMNLARLDVVDPRRKKSSDARPSYVRGPNAKASKRPKPPAKAPALGLTRREQAAFGAAISALAIGVPDAEAVRRIVRGKTHWLTVAGRHPLKVGPWLTARRLQRAAALSGWQDGDQSRQAADDLQLYGLMLSAMPRGLRSTEAILDGRRGVPWWSRAARKDPFRVLYWSMLRALQRRRDVAR